MPLQLPNLDDRNYNDLVSEAIAMIPRYAPTWTNYNASDPGITLIELLAYFSEMLIYRLDRIGREHKGNFLRLLAGPEGVNDEQLKASSLEDIERKLQHAVLELKKRQRAVTREDYEFLGRQAALRVCGQAQGVRVRCVEGKNLAAGGAERDIDRPGHISLIVVADRDKIPVNYEQLLKEVHNELEPKRLLTTRLHIVKPCYVWLALTLIIQPRDDASWEKLTQSIQDKLSHAYSPVSGGGPDQSGWPFGRNLYVSEIADILDHLEGVDYVETLIIQRLSLTEDDLFSGHEAVIGVQVGVSSTVGTDTRIGTKFSDVGRLIADGAGKIAGIMLKPYELLKITVRQQDITRAGIDNISTAMTGER